MSFFCNFQSDKCPGPISGNPLNGLCEKVCLQAKKVFDACMQQSQLNSIVLNITDLSPANPTYPLTFVSAKSSSSKGTISNLLVEPLAEMPVGAHLRARARRDEGNCQLEEGFHLESPLPGSGRRPEGR